MAELLNARQLRRLFNVFDVDGSGSLSRAEVEAILTRKGGGAGGLAPEDVTSLMEHFDADGDGQLSLDEFCKAWCGEELGPRVATRMVVDTILREAIDAGPATAYTPPDGWLEYTGLQGVFAPVALCGFAPPSASPAVDATIGDIVSAHIACSLRDGLAILAVTVLDAVVHEHMVGEIEGSLRTSIMRDAQLDYEGTITSNLSAGYLADGWWYAYTQTLKSPVEGMPAAFNHFAHVRRDISGVSLQVSYSSKSLAGADAALAFGKSLRAA
jgi:hypothetical protein